MGLIEGEPTGPDFGQRLRVLRGSAADPLNLIQVMLAKGATGVLAASFQISRVEP
jgi:hypothetical protein